MIDKPDVSIFSRRSGYIVQMRKILFNCDAIDGDLCGNGYSRSNHSIDNFDAHDDGVFTISKPLLRSTD